MGAILLGAGRFDEAISWLTVAAKICNFVPNACVPYAKVQAAWPNPKPRSVSVDTARAHAKKLGCPARN